MSLTIAKYTFNSWLRKGIGAGIQQTDNLGNGVPTVVERATIPIDVQVNTSPVSKSFSLLGPGDIIGINPLMVTRTEPRNWITNFEPNYLAFIEFYDEDFLWRYTPAKANGDKLRPWVVLLVLKDADKDEDREFVRNDKKFPLPSVVVKSGVNLPAVDQTWAWAHVHTNDGYSSLTDFEAFLESLHDLNNPNADKIISRLMCPRKLDPNSAYRAFVVPAFETGRLAGLGMDTTHTDAQQPSWTTGANGIEFPIYYDWYFRTGEDEDFESLVKALQPRVMDDRVGRRDMDGSEPGFGMTVGTDIGAIPPPTANQEIIGLEGALKAPTTKSSPETIDTSKPFFTQLQGILNFPAIVQQQTNNSADPVVCPPIYGENHAMVHELDVTNEGWLHQLNRDPRNRVPSGFGTNVIQKGQDGYMARAWAQVQKILEANRKILFTAFSMSFASTLRTNFTSKLSPEKSLLVFSPLLKKVKGSPTTLRYQLQQSNLPTAAVSPAMRRMIRPRGAYFKKLKNADASFTHLTLLTDLNSGKVSAAPPKQAPPDLTTVDDLGTALPVSGLSDLVKWLIKNRLLLLILILIALLLIALFTGSWLVCLVLAAAAVGAYLYAGTLSTEEQTATELQEPAVLVTDLQHAPPQPSFQLRESDPISTVPAVSGTTVSTTTQATSASAAAVRFNQVTYYTPTSAGQDSLEARNFRGAAISLNQRLAIEAPVRVTAPFDITNAYTKLMAATDPRVAYPKQLAALVNFTFNPGWLLQFEHLVPAMAYPDFEDPMYEKLRDISSELLIPNLTLIPPNTISLLVTNPEFIESYMVGLNHEFGKELLWRGYPTDERGSYFRQFWDVKGIIAPDAGLTQQQITEKYKDITPLDKWTGASHLGDHNNRGPQDKKNVVLVVRGELFKKYPSTIVYAQKAHIGTTNGVPDPNADPVIAPVATATDMANEIRFPIFKADIDPDLKFFGFELTIDEARGAENPRLPADDWGYYFIIQQIPGDPTYGMDIHYDPDDAAHISWDDLSWEKYDPSKLFIDTTVKPNSGFHPQAPDNINQWGVNSANMAYILYQKPVMIAVHAKEMLGNVD